MNSKSFVTYFFFVYEIMQHRCLRNLHTLLNNAKKFVCVHRLASRLSHSLLTLISAWNPLYECNVCVSVCVCVLCVLAADVTFK